MSYTGDLWRRAVTYQLDGNLLRPLRMHPPERASRENGLIFEMAELAGAGDERIVAFAEKHGALGPMLPTPLTPPAEYVGWFLQAGLGIAEGAVREMGDWLAHGGNSPIPSRLAPLAHVLKGMLSMHPGQLQELDRLLEDPAARPKDAAATQWAFVEALTDYAASMPLIESQVARGAEVTVRPERPVDRTEIGMAATYFEKLNRAMAAEGGAVGLFVGRMNDLVTLASSAPGRFEIPGLRLTETLETYRYAAGEAATWTAAAGLLSRRAWTPATRAEALEVLRRLGEWAGYGYDPDADWPAVTSVEDAAAVRRELMALLTVRLKQIHAWPHPSGRAVGSFARALWSLWAGLSIEPRPRVCTYVGCTQPRASVHGNARYCLAHRREMDRSRSAANRQRASEPEQSNSDLGSGHL